MEKATKQEIVTLIHENNDLKKNDILKYTDLVLDAIKKIIMEGKNLEIRGFGTFEVKQWDDRKATNPQNGQAIETSGHKSVIFHPGKDLKKF